MKDYFKKVIANLNARKATLDEALINEDSKEKRAEIGATLKSVMEELQAANEQLANIEAEENEDQEGRSLNPMGQFNLPGAKKPVTRNVNPLASMEYREAFMKYVQRGIKSPLFTRSDDQVETNDLGILLPETIVQEIIKGVEKVYGQLYSRVKKTNLKGGVKYPVGSFSAQVYWQGTGGSDSENGVSEKQAAGGVTSYVEFTYHIGEIRIAQSLLESILDVDVFEKEIVNALVEAYVKEMDTLILDGNGVKQPTGIFTNVAAGIQRIAAGNIISFSAADMADWTKWQKKLFSVIPLAMRKEKYQFVMTTPTWEGNIMTLENSNGDPIYRETFNPVTGDEICTFKGKEVVLIEEGTSIKNFDDATANQYFGMVWLPEKAYAINSNMQFGYKKYFDENTNQYITKALLIVDGKIVDPKYIYLLKKSA